MGIRLAPYTHMRQRVCVSLPLFRVRSSFLRWPLWTLLNWLTPMACSTSYIVCSTRKSHPINRASKVNSFHEIDAKTLHAKHRLWRSDVHQYWSLWGPTLASYARIRHPPRTATRCASGLVRHAHTVRSHSVHHRVTIDSVKPLAMAGAAHRGSRRSAPREDAPAGVVRRRRCKCSRSYSCSSSCCWARR
jgi:hypothetical protein